MNLGYYGSAHYAMQDTANKINTQINIQFLLYYAILRYFLFNFAHYLCLHAQITIGNFKLPFHYYETY